MFIRLAHWACRPECWDQAAELFETGALPILARQKGAVAAQLVGKTGGNERIAVTIWDDKESYQVFLESEAMKTITEMFASMYVDDQLPVGIDYPVIREQIFKPLEPTA